MGLVWRYFCEIPVSFPAVDFLCGLLLEILGRHPKVQVGEHKVFLLLRMQTHRRRGLCLIF